jgi:protein-S-isoprenylcysteine O-methyltransferase Ste14
MPKEQDRPGTNKNIHPPVVASLFIFIAYVLGRLIPLRLAVPAFVQNLGLLLTFAGFLLGIGALLEFRKARTTLDPHGSSTQVVTSGIYRFTRNPIYLGFLLMLIGLPLVSGLYWGVVLSPFYILTMNRLIIEQEETYLEKKFGNAYISYASRVRRWL